MLVILSEIWSYETENFKWRNSGPYEIGHNKRLVISFVVIMIGAYCIITRSDKKKKNETVVIKVLIQHF